MLGKQNKDNTPLFFVSQSYITVANAGSKPSSDFEAVLRRLNFKGIGLHSIYIRNGYHWWVRNWLSVQLAKIIMPKKGIAVFQYPEQRQLASLLDRAQKRGNRIIMLIHDINELRGFPNNHPDWLRSADVVIAHSPAMQLWLKDNYNVDNTINLGVFDYLTYELPNKEKTYGKPSVIFAGRLDKSDFIPKMCISNPKVDFVLFGPGFPETLRNKTNVCYKGVCPPDELPSLISQYNFGLVWDGNSIDGCEGATGNYVKYNSPYKISSYLAAGIPVIVWNKMAVAQFVNDNKIGLVVSSLSELTESLSSVTNDEYQMLCNNVSKVRTKLTTGGYYEAAIKKALRIIYKNE